MSWLFRDDGYDLFCNRDEKRTRALAHGPRVQSRDGVLFLAPTDGAAGGTWLGANQFGVSACLLNGVAGRGGRAGQRSRGLLLPELLSASSSAEMRERVFRCDLAMYSPFTLAMLEPGGRAEVMAWDGEAARMLDESSRIPLISSSFDPDGVRAARRAEFDRRMRVAGGVSAETLEQFHRSHAGGADAYSTCMHREDAQTVSFSSVSVSGSHIEFAYVAGAPCCFGPCSRLRLSRTR